MALGHALKRTAGMMYLSNSFNLLHMAKKGQMLGIN